MCSHTAPQLRHNIRPLPAKTVAGGANLVAGWVDHVQRKASEGKSLHLLSEAEIEYATGVILVL